MSMNKIQSPDEVNDIRSNIIELVLQLFKQFDGIGEEVHLTFENKELRYVPRKGMWIEGCADKVFVRDYLYSSVSLGLKICSYHHLPYYWLKSLMESESNEIR